MENMSPIECIGILGAMTYLLSYALVQWKPGFVYTLKYSAMNFTAAGAVLVSLSLSWNLPSAILYRSVG